MGQNICHFIPMSNKTESITIINFVLETNPQKLSGIHTEAIYKMHYVINGEGEIQTPGRITPIKKGDLFFTFPSVPFSINPKENLEYIYISFIGFKGNMMLDTLKIGRNNFVFHELDELHSLWLNGISTNPEVSDWMSESILLHTFSYLGNRLLSKKNEPKQSNVANLVKKYIDDNFTLHGFSIEEISQSLSYNKKYISLVFKKHFGIGIIDYLNIIRIQNACTLMDQGFTCVSDIADKCGYSDPQYFSRVFKTRTGIAPSKYRKSLRNE